MRDKKLIRGIYAVNIAFIKHENWKNIYREIMNINEVFQFTWLYSENSQRNERISLSKNVSLKTQIDDHNPNSTT